MRRNDHLAVDQLHLLVPVVDRVAVDVGADVVQRLEDRGVRLDLLLGVAGLAIDGAQREVALPIDPMLDELPDVTVEEV